jgi:hypothetical protein
MVDEYMGPKTLMMFNDLREMQAVASSIAINEVQAPIVSWNDDHSVLSMHGIDITMLNIRSGTHAFARKVMALACDIARVANPFDTFIAPSNLYVAHGSGQCILDHPSIVKFTGRSNPVIAAWMSDFTRGTVGNKWNSAVVQKFLTLTGQLTRLLAVLLFITNGSFPRAPDFMALTISDTQMPSSVQRQNDQWVLNFRHGKLMSHMVAHFTTCGFVSELLDQLFSFVLLQVRPAEILAVRWLRGDQAATLYRSHLFVADQEHIDEAELSHCLKSMTCEYWNAGEGLSVAPFRQATSSMVNTYLAKNNLALTILESDARAQSFGHSEITHALQYDRSHKENGQPTEMHKDFQLLHRAWNQVVMPHLHLPPATPVHPLPDLSIRGVRMGALNTNSLGLPSSSIPSRDPTYQYIDRTVEVMMEQMRRQNEETYRRMLAMMEDLIDDRFRGGQVKSVVVTQDTERYAEVLNYLRQAMNDPLLQARPGQAEVLMQLMSHRLRNLLAVLPCGSGKSATFLVPAATFQSHLLHLLVVPTTALAHQCKRDATSQGIDAWDYARDPVDLNAVQHGLLIVTPESLDPQSYLFE